MMPGDDGVLNGMALGELQFALWELDHGFALNLARP